MDQRIASEQLGGARVVEQVLVDEVFVTGVRVH